MTKNILTEAEYERIILEACEKPFGPDVIVVDGRPTEKDYLYAVWYRIGKHLGWEMPMLPPPDNRSEVEVLRDEIHRLVADHQATNYPIQPTLHKHISAALSERESDAARAQQSLAADGAIACFSSSFVPSA